MTIDPWTVLFRPNPAAGFRLFCFPYAGSGASIFQSWPSYLPSSVEVVGIQLPGRTSRWMEPPVARLDTLIAGAVQGIAPLLDRPFAFYGHSMGAMLAFEVACELRTRGLRQPLALFLAAFRAPDQPPRNPPIRGLPEPKFRAALRNLNGTPPEVLAHAELMDLVSPVLRADFTICETYQYVPRPPLTCAVRVFGGLSDRDVAREQLQAWAGYTDGRFALNMLPGDHFFIHTATVPLLNLIAADLQELLAGPE